MFDKLARSVVVSRVSTTDRAKSHGPIPLSDPGPHDESGSMSFLRPPAEPAPIADAARLGTVLGIWAHPDDEAFLSAGLMAAVRDAGNRVVCVTATLGELGTDDPIHWPPHRLGAVRRHELRASLAALDVTEHHSLGLS